MLESHPILLWLTAVDSKNMSRAYSHLDSEHGLTTESASVPLLWNKYTLRGPKGPKPMSSAKDTLVWCPHNSLALGGSVYPTFIYGLRMCSRKWRPAWRTLEVGSKDEQLSWGRESLCGWSANTKCLLYSERQNPCCAHLFELATEVQCGWGCWCPVHVLSGLTFQCLGH